MTQPRQLLNRLPDTRPSGPERQAGRAAAGSPVCVAVTDLNGIIVARSSFESSFSYRSAVLFGTFTRLSGPDVPRALDVITERFMPGRLAEIRGAQRPERAATMVLSMPIRDWSMKISGGWPTDAADDVAGGAWAGVVPFHAEVGDPQPAPDLRPGIPVPASVCAMRRRRPQRRGPVGDGPVKEPASHQ